MPTSAQTINDACQRIAEGKLSQAAKVIRENYPFKPVKPSGRKYTEYESLCVFLRDGFIDRYSGSKLVNPGVLRLLSALLPDEFPAHPNWKQSESHIAFWELFPTIDHVIPVARGGPDCNDNWVTTSMLRNSAKSNALLEEIDWSLQPVGDCRSWDGLTGWLIAYVRSSNNLASITGDSNRHKNYVQRWTKASARALTTVCEQSNT